MDTRLRGIGWLTVITALAGSALAILIIAWPDQVPDTRWSFPFATGPYIGTQVIFALHHALLLPGIVVVWRLAASSVGRSTKAGLALTVAFTLISSIIELAAIAGAEVSKTSGTANALGAAYGFMTLGLGLGFLLAGVGFVRRPVLPGEIGRWVYLAIGVWTFFPMLPSLFMPLVWGRITIGTWYFMYVGIGVGLLRRAAGKEERAPKVQATV